MFIVHGFNGTARDKHMRYLKDGKQRIDLILSFPHFHLASLSSSIFIQTFQCGLGRLEEIDTLSVLFLSAGKHEAGGTVHSAGKLVFCFSRTVPVFAYAA